MMKPKMYIDGQWVDSGSGEVVPIRSPATGEVLAEVPQGNGDDVRKAVEAACKAKALIAGTPVFERAKMCHAIADFWGLKRKIWPETWPWNKVSLIEMP